MVALGHFAQQTPGWLARCWRLLAVHVADRCRAAVQGGDFIQLTRKMTGAKVAVDKAVGRAEDRLVHVEGMDE